MLHSPATNPHYTLLTGATGLVGRYLMRNLLRNGVRLAVLVRDSGKISASQRVENICQYWEQQLGERLPRPVCLTGDVSKPGLGLSSQDFEWIEKYCDTCFHNAAILSFQNAPRDQEPWVTNLGGTENVLKLCEEYGIKHMHYVSTAYVCGKREGSIKESELDCGQEFRNDYEASKFEAEKLVQESKLFETKTIYRPAVITADSKTGYTTTYHGLHLYLRLLSLLVPKVEPDENGIRHTNIRLPMNGDEPRNVVTVDWVADVMTELFLNREAHGETYHLSPQEKLTPRTVIDACYKYFNSTGVKYVGDEETDDEDRGDQYQLSKFEGDFLSNVGVYMLYDCCDPDFQTSNLNKFAGHIKCPIIAEDTIHRFLDFGDHDRWGKRREKPLDTGFTVVQNLDRLHEQATRLVKSFARSAECYAIGFDVVGVGGGQWHFDTGSKTLQRGLPPNGDDPVVRITVDSLCRIFRKPAATFPASVELQSDLASFVNAEAYQ